MLCVLNYYLTSSAVGEWRESAAELACGVTLTTACLEGCRRLGFLCGRGGSFDRPRLTAPRGPAAYDLPLQSAPPNPSLLHWPVPTPAAARKLTR